MKRKERIKKEQNGNALFVLLLLLVPVVWGYGFLVTEDALASGLSVSAIMAGRFLIAAAALFFFRLIFGAFRKEKFTKKDVWAGAIVGAINFGGFFLQTAGLKYTDAAKSGMITGAYVVIVPVVSCVLQRKFKLRAVLTAAAFFVGMLFLFDVGKERNFNKGDLITLACSVFFAVQILLVDRLGGGVPPVNFTAVQMLTMGVLGAFGALLSSPAQFGGANVSAAILPLLYLGLLSSAFSYIVQTLAQKHISPSLTAIILSLESLVSVLFSLALGRTAFSVPLALGCAIMFGSCMFAALTEQGKTQGETQGKSQDETQEETLRTQAEISQNEEEKS